MRTLLNFLTIGMIIVNSILKAIIFTWVWNKFIYENITQISLTFCVSYGILILLGLLSVKAPREKKEIEELLSMQISIFFALLLGWGVVYFVYIFCN